MSVLYCTLPNFLVSLALRHTPQLAGAPLALLGSDERVWAASPQAREWGVAVGQPARTARARCPHLLLRPVDPIDAQAEQDAFLAEMARWELPMEEHEWGAGYIDLHTVAARADDVRPLAMELGRRVRTGMSGMEQPRLGWDSGKFTARAAAQTTQAGTLRLVGKTEERRFLAPLSVTLLPLPAPTLQQLSWLGIRTLGQYADLPPTAVWQRWGQPGKLAQRWAQGKDNRPVTGTPHTIPETFTLDLDPPTEQLGRPLADLMELLRPTLKRLGAHLAGVRRMRLRLSFLPAAERILEIPFVAPVSQEARIHTALAQALQSLVWPGELERAEITVLAVGELMGEQLRLLEEASLDAAPMAALALRLGGVYGRCFFMSRVIEENHPVAERTFLLQPC